MHLLQRRPSNNTNLLLLFATTTTTLRGFRGRRCFLLLRCLHHPNQTKYTPHLLISTEHKTQPYTRPQIGKGVVVAECSGMRCNEILRVKHVKMHWRKNKSASVTKKNKGIEGTRAQSTKQGSDSEQEIHGKGKNDLLVVKGKHDLEK